MTDNANAYFDRFDVCEAWYAWAHDWGEYAVVTRLQRMGFSFGRSNSQRERLEPNGQAIYDALNARSKADPDWHARLRVYRIRAAADRQGRQPR